MSSVETYKPGDNNWTQIQPMQTRRSGVVAMVYKSRLWVLGGFDGQSRLKSTEFFSGRAWNEGPKMNTRRSNFTGASINGRIMVCGGYNERNGTLCCVESIKINFNGDTNGWKRDQDMNITRSALSSVVLNDLLKERVKKSTIFINKKVSTRKHNFNAAKQIESI